MKMKSIAPIRVAKIGYIVMSAAFCVIGLLLILYPLTSAATISQLLGIALLIFGAVKLVGYFSRDLYRLAFQFDLELGILLILIGLVLLLQPEEMLNVITILIGIAFVADSLFKLRIAHDARDFGIRSWRLISALAILTALIGLLLVFMPDKSIAALTVCLGVMMLSEGAMSLFVALSTVKIVQHQYPDVIDMPEEEREEAGD